MLLQRLASKVSVLAPAKINLFLELLEKRPDGFHELETVMVAVSLFDRLEITPLATSEIELDCAWETGQTAQANQWEDPAQFLGDLPPMESNLVYRAVKLLQTEENVPHGARIILRKRIPSASGFGGASSDAAAALMAANLAWNLGCSINRLSELAASLGSDIPFFLHAGQLGSGLAMATGRGEKIATFPGKRLDLVLIRPAGGLSTPEVFRRCRIPASPESAQPLLASLQSDQQMSLPPTLTNRLSLPARELSSTIDRVANACEQLDVVAHQMSGSGSGYFAICRNRPHAMRVAARLRAANVGMVFPVTTCGIRALRN
ncbi:4-(cytidine 5'-diphospho)-2-C-methyl-D-erythritol kinase [Bremerella cremea]|uniref:4-diphosphocytidyl-2-C-methyl-D-erythritol kinase n=1 Tax=Bremerella cremea TaxID=1031537 RepID=A0A368KRV6_9BACT|nr:4-(cytidine 5'-diphospho)-2-C-methyl-D-erythritol kinase [Bremerella cremea]RCS47627.1 4-(cytidine 5'-diphospho)-2-C-methyl-D-erythritol kinase [Bremerella cremea]